MLNQVALVGRLTKDPDLRYTPEGKAVSNITLAVTRNFKNADGEYGTDFVNCTLWNRAAENTASYCQKGSVVSIVGRIHTRNYENPEGKRTYVTEVIVESVNFLDRKRVNNLINEGSLETNAVPIV